MIRRRPVWIAVVFVFLVGNSAGAQTGSHADSSARAADIAAIKSTFLKRQDTFNARDLGGQLRLVTDDFVFNGGTGKLHVAGKENYGLLMLVAWDRPMNRIRIREEVEDVAFLGKDVAVAHFHLQLLVPEGANPNYTEMRGMRVLVKREDHWLFRVSCHIPYLETARLTPEEFERIKEQYRPRLEEAIGR